MRVALLFCALLGLASCANQSQAPADQAPAPAAPPAPPKEPASKLDAAGTKQLMSVVGDYYKLKDALVASNGHEAETAAGVLVVSVDSLNRLLKSMPELLSNVQKELDSVRMGAASMTRLYPESLEEKQRAALPLVSDNMFRLLQKTQLNNAHIYRQYCPMALNNRGAFWLSSTDDIKNPYFGKKMLECGEVVDSLK
jgi:Cu(I)/Ag(I) efflux system membrane fusion protein